MKKWKRIWENFVKVVKVSVVILFGYVLYVNSALALKNPLPIQNFDKVDAIISSAPAIFWFSFFILNIVYEFGYEIGQFIISPFKILINWVGKQLGWSTVKAEIQMEPVTLQRYEHRNSI